MLSVPQPPLLATPPVLFPEARKTLKVNVVSVCRAILMACRSQATRSGTSRAYLHSLRYVQLPFKCVSTQNERLQTPDRTEAMELRSSTGCCASRRIKYARPLAPLLSSEIDAVWSRRIGPPSLPSQTDSAQAAPSRSALGSTTMWLVGSCPTRREPASCPLRGGRGLRAEAAGLRLNLSYLPNLYAPGPGSSGAGCRAASGLRRSWEGKGKRLRALLTSSTQRLCVASGFMPVNVESSSKYDILPLGSMVN